VPHTGILRLCKSCSTIEVGAYFVQAWSIRHGSAVVFASPRVILTFVLLLIISSRSHPRITCWLTINTCCRSPPPFNSLGPSAWRPRATWIDHYRTVILMCASRSGTLYRAVSSTSSCAHGPLCTPTSQFLTRGDRGSHYGVRVLCFLHFLGQKQSPQASCYCLNAHAMTACALRQ